MDFFSNSEWSHEEKRTDSLDSDAHSKSSLRFQVITVLIVELCLMNLVTATIVNAAFERQAADHEMVAREKKDSSVSENNCHICIRDL